MWQQRLDGKKKLKNDAIPTIFGLFFKKKNVVDNNLSINNESLHAECETVMNTSESLLFAEVNDANNVSDNNISSNQLINNSQDVRHEIIVKAEKIGFHVNFITSDMGPGNMRL
ncbi:PREDICTED: uncharacterized protein LOC105145932 isoform X2 [Acromyrmex echinatior]|nr:PREDICTED: uncharacterized protein LOC105145932 isoform X2 [Acromyrmex echinatior]XP_011054136.1 PREDICTED: uncharacterized protein LOC105145932 isoform X2 [Acromyrmex echinatior]XP_011054137.1 PREDICTED: uncharacterized protein LOC105145932 isoform X2 [Acromyrmex echinatior]